MPQSREPLKNVHAYRKFIVESSKGRPFEAIVGEVISRSFPPGRYRFREIYEMVLEELKKRFEERTKDAAVDHMNLKQFELTSIEKHAPHWSTLSFQRLEKFRRDRKHPLAKLHQEFTNKISAELFLKQTTGLTKIHRTARVVEILPRK